MLASSPSVSQTLLPYDFPLSFTRNLRGDALAASVGWLMPRIVSGVSSDSSIDASASYSSSLSLLYSVVCPYSVSEKLLVCFDDLVRVSEKHSESDSDSSCDSVLDCEDYSVVSYVSDVSSDEELLILLNFFYDYLFIFLFVQLCIINIFSIFYIFYLLCKLSKNSKKVIMIASINALAAPK